MNKERKDLENKIESNYKKYKLIQKQLNENNNFDISNQLRELYFEINSLRYNDGIEMIKEIYEIK